MDFRTAYTCGRLWSAREVERSAIAPEPLRIVRDWISSFIVRPHCELGRAGVVCPFVPSSLKIDVLWPNTAVSGASSEHEMCQVAKHYMKVYEDLQLDTTEAEELKTFDCDLPGCGGSASLLPHWRIPFRYETQFCRSRYDVGRVLF